MEKQTNEELLWNEIESHFDTYKRFFGDNDVSEKFLLFMILKELRELNLKLSEEI
jgi:hypothetical protein